MFKTELKANELWNIKPVDPKRFGPQIHIFSCEGEERAGAIGALKRKWCCLVFSWAKNFLNDSINMNKLFIYSPKLDIDIYGNVFSTLYLFLRYKEKTAALSNNCLLMRD